MRKRAISFENGKNHSDEVCSVCAQKAKNGDEIDTCKYLFICGIFFVEDTESLGAITFDEAEICGKKCAQPFLVVLPGRNCVGKPKEGCRKRGEVRRGRE